MSHIDDYVNYRISKSKETLKAAKILAQNDSWTACINRLYYACFYAVSALLLRNQLNSKTHSGVRSLFNSHFVKAGKASIENGELYSNLMEFRIKGDYNDMFDFNKENVEPLIPLVASFIDTINALTSSQS